MKRKKEKNTAMYPSVCAAVEARGLREANFLLADFPVLRKLNSSLFSYESVIINDKGK